MSVGCRVRWARRASRVAGSYVIQFLAGAGQLSQVAHEHELREFLVGNAVDAQDAHANWRPAVVEYHSAAGDYRVRFADDGSTHLCTPAQVRKPATAAAAPAQQPLLSVEEARRVGLHALDVILATLNDNKRAVVAAGDHFGEAERRTLLVLGQVMRHLRVMFEAPAHEVPPFELRLGDPSRGDAATYARLRDTILTSIDYLAAKFITLHRLVAHPQAEQKKLNAVVNKIQRLYVWLVNVTSRIKSL